MLTTVMTLPKSAKLKTHLSHNLRSPVVITTCLAQSRSFYGRRHGDWLSHLDPVDSRSIRYRTLRTKAKLFEKLRRRGKFEWDVAQRPFFSPKYIRWASHYPDRPSRNSWTNKALSSDVSKSAAANDINEADVDNNSKFNHEWSEREKRWKARMDNWKERLERDPYEAVFGRRFEPFWTTILPDRSPKTTPGHTRSEASSAAAPDNSEPIDALEPGSQIKRRHETDSTQPSPTYPPAHSVDVSSDSIRAQPCSANGGAAQYQYDPITNRMVLRVSTVQIRTGLDLLGEPLNKVEQLSKEETHAPVPRNEDNLDSLTAEDVRAGMGRSQGTRRSAAKRLVQVKPIAKATEQQSSASDNAPSPLQPAILRVPPSPAFSDVGVLDDAAAHESTGGLPRDRSVPAQWSEQADVLQTARIARSALSRSDRAILDVSDISVVSDKDGNIEQTLQAAANENKHDQLQALVDCQAAELQQNKTRYAQKVKALRDELDVAYKQSSKHSQIHLDRIQSLQQELTQLQQSAKANSPPSILNPQSSRQRSAKTNVLETTDGDFPVIDKELERVLTKMEHKSAYNFRPDGLEGELIEARDDWNEADAIVRTSNGKPKDDAIGGRHFSHDSTHHLETNNIEGTYPDQASDSKAETFNYEYRSDDIEAALKQSNHETSRKKTLANPFDVLMTAASTSTTTAKSGKHPQVSDSLAEKNYDFKSDALEVELSEQETKSRPSMKIMAPKETESKASLVARSEEARANTPTHPFSVNLLQDSHSPVPAQPGIAWQDPPLYKVLAYDSGNDMMSTATTTATYAPCEHPISVASALSQLYQPARFISHFAELHRDGFQVVYGSPDLLIFKKVRSDNSDRRSNAHQQEVSAVQPIIKPTTPDASTTVPSDNGSQKDFASIIDHGLLVPQENALAQEAASFYDRQLSNLSIAEDSPEVFRKAQSVINPVDLTTRSTEASPQTGNFASPTGFVNYDPLFPNDEPASRPQSVSEGGEHGKFTRHDRVRRTEPVFSGSSTAQHSPTRQWRAEERRERREERRQRRRRGAGALRWVISVGLTSAAICYGIGLAAERSRRKEMEKYQY